MSCRSNEVAPGRTGRRWVGTAVAAAAGLAAVLAAPASAQYGALAPRSRTPDQRDAMLKQVRQEQKLNAQIPLDTVFRDENGKTVRLHEYFGKKPVALMLIQFQCTMLCTEEMNVLMDSLKQLSFTPGKEFNLLIVSIDPRETPELAREKKLSHLEVYGRPEAAAGWHFLTGDKPSIDRLADAVGYHYAYDDRSDQYAHPDGVIVATPHGKTARYYVSLDYAPQALKFGLMEAANNKIGTVLDKFSLLCFHYDPVSGKYGLAVMNLVRMAGIATIVGLALAIGILKRRDRRERRRLGDAIG